MLTHPSPAAVFSYRVLVASTEDNPAYLGTSYRRRPYHSVSGYEECHEEFQLVDERAVDHSQITFTTIYVITIGVAE